MRSTLTAVIVGVAVALTSCTVEVQPRSPTSATAAGTGAESRAEDEQSAVRAVDEFWRRYFARTGQPYEPPRVAGGYRGADGPSCAGEQSVPGNAYYCAPGDYLAWDEQLMAAGYEQIGDAWVYLIIAHEWGHAVQARLVTEQVSVAAELQADCLAGAALQGAVDEGLIALEPGDPEEVTATLVAVADEYPWTDVTSHGDARQRAAAFRAGVDGGVGACV